MRLPDAGDPVDEARVLDEVGVLGVAFGAHAPRLPHARRVRAPSRPGTACARSSRAGRGMRVTVFGVSPLGSTDTAMICALAASWRPHQVLRDAQVGGDQRTDVRAVRVEERDQHRLAACSESMFDRLAEVVVQRQRRRRRAPARAAPAASNFACCVPSRRLAVADEDAASARRRCSARRATSERQQRSRRRRSSPRWRIGERTYQCGPAPRLRLAPVRARAPERPRRQEPLQSSLCNASCERNLLLCRAVRAESLAPRGRGAGDPMQPIGCGGESPQVWRSVEVYASPTANPVGAKQRNGERTPSHVGIPA